MAEPGSRTWDSGLGATLRARRLSQGFDLATVAETLNVRQPFLHAIEDGRYEELPGPTYAAGFVRAYAEHLGLDSEQAVRQFKLETLGRTIGVDLNFPTPETERGLPKWPILVASVLLLVLAYGAWSFLTSNGDEGDVLVAEVPERLAPTAAGEPASVALPVPAVVNESPADPQTPPDEQPSPDAQRPSSPSPPSADAEAAPSPPTDPDPAPEPAAQDNLASSLPPLAAQDNPGYSPPPPAASRATEGAAAPATVETPVPVANEAERADRAGGEDPSAVASDDGNADAVDAADSSEVEEAESLSPDEPQVVLLALADSWISVRDADGGVLVERILPAGESLAVDAGRGYSLATGNAGGLELTLDGEVVPPLGPLGAVRRNIALDPAALRPSEPAPPTPTEGPDAASAEPTSVDPSAPAPAAEAPAAQAPAVGGGEAEPLVLHATAETWVEVRNGSGRVVVRRVLPAGETISVDPAGGFSLVTGNAGGLEVIVDGEIQPPLGRPGQVRRGIILSPEALRAGAAR